MTGWQIAAAVALVLAAAVFVFCVFAVGRYLLARRALPAPGGPGLTPVLQISTPLSEGGMAARVWHLSPGYAERLAAQFGDPNEERIWTAEEVSAAAWPETPPIMRDAGTILDRHTRT